jgi:hypothetical protein
MFLCEGPHISDHQHQPPGDQHQLIKTLLLHLNTLQVEARHFELHSLKLKQKSP